MQELSKIKNSFLVDIEAIRINNHDCLREIGILHVRTNTYFSKHFIPCEDFYKLLNKDKKSFDFCFYNIHGLTYFPRPTLKQQTFLSCCEAPSYLFNLVGKYATIYYKGGHLERNLCQQLGLKCFDLEQIHLQYDTLKLPIQKVSNTLPSSLCTREIQL